MSELATTLSPDIRASAAKPTNRRLALASMVGTSLEWYDFTVYNTLAALVFGKLFFPSIDPLAGLILAFSTYAVGYVSRPFGGFVLGHLGDRLGRRAVLVITLVLMGLTTGAMGFLPTYAAGAIAAMSLYVCVGMTLTLIALYLARETARLPLEK
ncbi:MFS transporter [Robbsia sp. KACC 23696]|uniref:MFS transporter n=1 Tax=Robbsia sp. KACC 23696 TaxID=3149231 RepID=UPI00325B7BBD